MNQKKYLDLEGLALYDELIKEYISKQSNVIQTSVEDSIDTKVEEKIQSKVEEDVSWGSLG